LDFRRLLQDKRVVVPDRAMGTQLDRKGLMGRGNADLETRQAVPEIHGAYAEAGADIIGANCGALDPLMLARVVAARRAATDRPITGQPNAGKRRLVEDRTVFDMELVAFADGIAACMRAGARILGGCCGTSPGHLRAVCERIRDL
jgi:methionine synthase I (cobalamin-dependent)